MTSQLRAWLDEKRSFSRECRDVAASARVFVSTNLGGSPDLAALTAIEPLIDPLVLSVEAARARDLAEAGEGQPARFLLPHHPLPLWREGDPPPTRDLLLAVHLMHRFAGVGDARSTLDEHQRLRLYLDLLLDSPEGSILDRIGTEVRERLRYRRPQTAFHIVEALLLDAARLASGGDLGQLRQRFEAECDHLEVEGFDEHERARIREYLVCLLSRHARSVILRAGNPSSGAETASVGRIRNAQDVRALLHASLLFHLSASPAATHETFRRRIDIAREALTRGSQARILKALQKPDVTDVYTFWSTASDEEFAGAIAALS